MTEKMRAEIVSTGNKYKRAGSITIEAPADQIFALIADPRNHPLFDGSGTLRGNVRGPERLELGSKFGMDMKLVANYRIKNTVVEFEEGRRIAWCHPGHHRWRYELEPVGDNNTIVTETFDGSTARIPVALKLMNAYENNQKAILKTLSRLKDVAENNPSSTV
jgi:uncharacterized protein YndB with AHSA1/START domain